MSSEIQEVESSDQRIQMQQLLPMGFASEYSSWVSDYLNFYKITSIWI